jgi:lipoteichoic acid synthase
MKERIRTEWQQYFPWMTAFVVCLIMLRIYESLQLMSQLEEGNTNLVLKGIVYDVGFALACSVAVLIVQILISLFNTSGARVVSVCLMAFVLLISFSVIQYFTVTKLPLSADLFGYSLDEIKTTVGSSGGSSFLTYLIALTWVAAFVVLGIYFSRIKFVGSISKSWISMVAVVVFTVVLPIHPNPEQYERTLDYYIVLNKPSYFVSKTWVFWQEIEVDRENITGYPFLHEIKYSPSLGRYLNKASTNPNIVLIIVEGLGRDFTGPDAVYGGFTPYLDSLAQVSLTWNNFLSNAGRTFGALPSLLGSLPYGQNGFMSYGVDMPNHQTLIGLLKPYGYSSNFFYGGNPNFDNQDLFLERNGIDFMLNENNFPASYTKMKGSEDGSWGFGDKDVYTEAIQVLSGRPDEPRLDIFLTLTTHEPFISPEDKYRPQFDEKLKRLTTASSQAVWQTNAGIFTCLMYADDAIKTLMRAYAKRADYANTIFILTGDHRLIPLPSDNPMARFHVPLIIYSPLLKAPEQFNSISAHSGVTPTLLGWLHHQYGMDFPTAMPFLTDSISFLQSFDASVTLPLIRNKNAIEDYLEDNYFLTGDRLYKVLPDLNLAPERDDTRKRALLKKLARFKQLNRYVLENNKVDSVGDQLDQFTFSTKEKIFLESQKVPQANSDQQFEKAKILAYSKQYNESRACLKYLLNSSPNFHDARVLLARTYGWSGVYDSATLYLEQTLKRSPRYADAYVALADVAYWKGEQNRADSITNEGLQYHNSNAELLARKARSFYLNGKLNEARELVNQVLSQQPDNEIALDLKTKLNR